MGLSPRDLLTFLSLMLLPKSWKEDVSHGHLVYEVTSVKEVPEGAIGDHSSKEQNSRASGETEAATQ